MTKELSTAEIEAALGELGTGWTGAGDALVRRYRFGSFRDALAFMVRAGFEAEAMDHHPEWTNVFDRVDVRLNTHSSGGKVTAKDVELARRLERIARAGGAALSPAE